MTKKEPQAVVITGGGSGIGLATAKLLLTTQPEIKLILVGKEEQRLKEGLKALEAHSHQVSLFSCDLSNPQEIEKLSSRIKGSFKTLSGLVNNAGVYPFGGLSSTSLSDWNQTLQINLTASFLLTQGLYPLLKKNQNGARIVNVSSTAGILPNHFALAYSVSKAALIQLTRTLAKELGKDKITVNCVCPGIVRTPLHEAYHTSQSELEEFYGRRGATFPLGRVGEASDVASAIHFLLSQEASWITGDVLTVDGGRLLL